MGEFWYTLRNLAFTLGTIIVKCGQWIVGYKEPEEATLFGYPIVYVDGLFPEDASIVLGDWEIYATGGKIEHKDVEAIENIQKEKQ